MGAAGDGISIVYDGYCLFCANYVKLVRLREAVGTVELVDARTEHKLVAEVRAAGLDLNAGMAVKYRGRLYHAREAARLVSELSEPRGVLNRVARRVFGSAHGSRVAFPVANFAARTYLRLRGRPRM